MVIIERIDLWKEVDNTKIKVIEFKPIKVYKYREKYG